MLEIGSLVDGKYKILTKVGQGGMSVVYLAINEKANKQWAVKEVRKDGIKDFEVVKQGLVAETDILKKLNHPNLPSIIDVIDTDDSFIIIMDYIQGNSLNKALEEYGAQPQENVIEWAKQLCDVLGYLHTRTPAIIYRDMKPANVMLKPDGNVTLIDFGTAREFKEKNLADTTCLGTVGYAAPEQFGGMGQTDARTDIYCLGATLYHLVTGMNPCEPPYEIKPIREINPSLSSGLERIILKCTQRDPNDRYQSAAELMYALEHYEEIDDIYRKKQKRKLGAFIATSVLTLICAGISLWGYISAEDKKGENYDYIVATAQSGSNFEEIINNYFEAILTDPTRTEAYLGSEGDNNGLIEYLISDGILTSEENTVFTKLKAGLEQENAQGNISVTKVMESLANQNAEGYEEVCYQIGEAYLFYYDISVEKDKYVTAASWFQYAGNEYPAAAVYCEIADCLQNISKYEKAGQIGKLYEEYTALWEE
ncbi:MAG: serine/threonine protein kinase, partial [Agathobacter sp.]|nr:serine/threonine protein kinase [Agathobacter sp.]